MNAAKGALFPWGSVDSWTALPNDIHAYLYVDGFTPMTISVYWELLKHYNVEAGYAYPTQETLALALNTSKRTVIRNINTLANAGLISKKRNKSLVYFFNRPLKGADFAAKFPQAAAKRDKKRMTLEIRRMDDEERLRTIENKEVTE